MILLSISSTEHDSSICLIDDGKVLLYVQEERISKIKHDSSHPFSSLKLIKKYTSYIDLLIFANCNFDHDYYLNYFLKENIEIKKYHIDRDQHHLYHAASAFYGSGFSESICLVIDGWGAAFQLNDDLWGNETTSIYYASYPSKFNLLYKNIYYNPSLYASSSNEELENLYNWEINSHLDIGVVYGTTTRHIGFKRNDPGKTMGLSSYGKEDNSIPNFNVKNTIYSDKNLVLSNRTINTKLFPEIGYSPNDFQKRANISYKVQKYLEKVFLYRVDQALKLYPNCNNLVFSGGCALNILGNSLIKKEFPEINFYVDPVSNDACQSYGSAKYYYHDTVKSITKVPLTSLYTGPEYDLDDMKKLVFSKTLKYNSIENSLT